MKKLLFSALAFAAIVNTNASKAQLTPNSIAPDFTVSAFQTWLSTSGLNSNGTYKLYDYLDAGYTVFLDVSATWCGPCYNFHLSGALDDLYKAHGPSGQLGVNSTTTNDVMVLWVEGDGTTADATMLDGAGAIGNWTEPNATLGQIPYPMANPASALATQINNDYEIAYFPTIYKICPNRVVTEIGQKTAAELYASVAACPEPASAPADVAALVYEGSTIHCEGSYTPSVKIQNNGTSALTAATISVYQGANVVSTGTFSGNLATYGVSSVTCTPIANYTGGNLSVVVTTTGDASASNNTVNATVNVALTAASQFVYVNITTDRYASETSWKIKNNTGAVVAQGGGSWTDLPATGQTVQPVVEVVLSPSMCYTFEILDAYGDGICCNYGNGSYSVNDAGGNVLVSGSEFSDIAVGAFKTGVLGINENANISFNVFPNPATDIVNVSFEANNSDYTIALVDLQGRVMSSQELNSLSGSQSIALPVNELAKGSYIVTITSNGVTTSKNVVIK